MFVNMKAGATGTPGQLKEQITNLSGLQANYSFIIEEHDKLYEGEKQILSAVLIFTVLGILLSILGLIGLVNHDTEAKSREIALKKAFGAETPEIMFSLNLNILKIFLPALCIGSFVAWLIMREWIDNFVYRRGLEWWVFLSGAIIILIVALLSVSFQTWKAAKQSPAITLRSI